jgi:hypothetical protein
VHFGVFFRVDMVLIHGYLATYQTGCKCINAIRIDYYGVSALCMFVHMMCVGILAQLRSSQGRRCQIECMGCGNSRERRGLVSTTATSFMTHPHESWNLIAVIC